MDIHDQNFFYQETAEDVVNSILGLYKQGIKSFESHELWSYDVPISTEEEDHKYFNWKFEVFRSDELDDEAYDLIGFAGRDCHDEPSIEIGVVLPKGKHQKKTKLCRASLFDVVCHELHHLAQNIDNNHFSRPSKEEGKISYFLDPFEVEAFHIGTRAHAAISGLAFEEIARNYIRKSWPEGSEEQVTRVVTAWKNTAFEAFNHIHNPE